MSRVEYHDPDGLYPLIAPQLQAHLPLRHLFWNSANRPPRSIPSLGVDFYPSPRSPAGSDNARSREDGGVGRRHQLAGLRTTPLLKIFLLRCDDKESYKSSKRPLVRSWLEDDVRAAHGSSTASKQEKHDACEWLILHVVLPNTTAATQPRWSQKASASDDEGAKEKSASKRWPGKGSRGIFEKLRADFGAEKKSEIDHVAQIRLLASDMPPESLPMKAPGAPADHSETPKERENAWSDLLSKLKPLIIRSFDVRVGQYEDDIHARDLQRNLPGWNFCTFFVLKEGLALAFESVGLVEDALAIYDELSVEFETVLSEQESDDNPSTGGAFTSSTVEMSRLLWHSDPATLNSVAEGPDLSVLDNPLSTTRKDYRERIASSNASIFDMRCYLFSRQIALLLKLAKPLLGGQSRESNGVDALVRITQRDSWEGPEKIDDISALAKVCQLAPEAITSLARLLRQDLHDSAPGKRELTADEASSVEVILAAWTYSACGQLLAETASFRIPETSSKSDPASLPASPLARSFAEQRSSSGQNKHRSKAGNREPNAYPSDVPILRHEGLARSAAYRADVCLLQRRVIERVAAWHGWQLSQSGEISEIAEEEEEEDYHEAHSRSGANGDNADYSSPYLRELTILQGSALNIMASSAGNLRKNYRELSDVAAVLYLSAGRVKSAERLMADVGIMKYLERDYATAATYLGRVASRFAEGKWNVVESCVLKMHMACLKILNRKDDCLRVGLGLLAKNAESRRGLESHSIFSDSSGQLKDTQAANAALDEPGLDTKALLSELTDYSRQLTYDLPTPLNRYFADFENDRQIQLLKDCDGFQIGLTIRQLMVRAEITVDAVEARLISSEDGQSRELRLQTDGAVRISPTKTRIWLKCNVSTFGSYIFDKLTIRTGKILFTWEALGKAEASTPIGLLTSTAAAAVNTAKRAATLCYPRGESLRASLGPGRTVHLNKSRSIELRLETGTNEIKSGQIVVRSGSAGLRLRTAEARVFHGPLQIDASGGAGVISMTGSTSESTSVVSIPYELESNLPALYVRLEVDYATDAGSFSFFRNFDINNELGLDVTVQDMFKEQCIFSKFFVKPVGGGPIRLLSAQVGSSDSLDVKPASGQFSATTVFHREAACLTYRISRISKAESVAGVRDATLPLALTYRLILKDVVQATSDALAKAIDTSPFRHLKWLFVMTLEANLARNVVPADLDTAGLVGEFPLPPLHELGLDSVLEAVEATARGPVLAWLQSWCESHSTIAVSGTALNDAASEAQSLHIDFDIPRLQYLHTTSLRLEGGSNGSTGVYDGRLRVGTPLHARINTKYTREWDQAAGARIPQAEEQAFVYDVRIDDETWAVGGARRAQFEARAGEDKVFDVTLVALRAGWTRLPSVVIRPVGVAPSRPTSPSGDMGHAGQMLMSPTSTMAPASPAPTLGSATTGGWMFSPSVSSSHGLGPASAVAGVCETDCTTAGDTVHVTEGWKGVAIGLCDAEEEAEGEDEGQDGGNERVLGYDGQAHVLESEGWSEGSGRDA